MEDIKNYDSMNEKERWNLLAMVANLYYNSEMTQNQIAERLYTSRSKVSRMLKEARERGIVEIYIHEPWERNLPLEKALVNAFSLKTARIITLKEAEQANGLPRIAEAAAYHLDSIVKPDIIMGISWGNTLYHIINYIRTNNRKNIPFTVVPIMGAANVKSPERDSIDLAKELASAYGGKYRYIYAPLFVNTRELRDSLIQEENIKNVLDLSRNADAILTSIGSILDRSWDYHLSGNTLETLAAKGAVGHIGGHFFDINGKELSTSLANRMIGVSFHDLCRCPNVICVAYGEIKAEAILGALRSGIIDTLILDERCADAVLKIHESGRASI